MTVHTSEETAHPYGEVEEISIAEGARMLDDSARLNLNMTGEEFLAAWDEGRIPNPDSLRVQQVASLINFAR